MKSAARIAGVIVALCALLPHMAQAKRAEAAKVEPVVCKGVRYSAPNDDGSRGYVRATDEKTGKVLYDIVIYTTKVDPALEEDVQWVFITNLRIRAQRYLIVNNERGRIFSVDLLTRVVTEISANRD